MKLILFISIFLLFASPILAQDYEKSIGVTMGSSRSIFLDVPNDELSSYRFMIQRRDRGYTFTALKIFRRYDIAQLPDYISLYYGYGLHGGVVGWKETTNKDRWNENTVDYSSPVFGLDGIIGLSYAIEKTALAINCDTKPFFEFGGPRLFRVSPFYFSLGATLTF